VRVRLHLLLLALRRGDEVVGDFVERLELLLIGRRYQTHIGRPCSLFPDPTLAPSL